MLIDITMVITCFNERSSVQSWADSFFEMHSHPSELIVVDSESTDGGMDLFERLMAPYVGSLILIKQKCNISTGRNIAIRAAKNDKIAITDFGVTFSKSWVQEISQTLINYPLCSGVYVYRGNGVIQNSYSLLFSPDIERLDPKHFNPSSRSFGLRRTAVVGVGFYDEKLSIGEDTEFVLRLKKQNLTFGLNINALVYWEPRTSLWEISKQQFSYAFWDAIANQNRGRLKHIAYIMTLLFIFAIIQVISNIVISAVITTVSASLIVIRKMVLGMKGSNFSSLVLIYNLALASSAMGYSYGKIKKIFISV